MTSCLLVHLIFVILCLRIIGGRLIIIALDLLGAILLFLWHYMILLCWLVVLRLLLILDDFGRRWKSDMNLVVAIAAFVPYFFLLLIVEPLAINHVLELVGAGGYQINRNLKNAFLIPRHGQLFSPLVKRAGEVNIFTPVNPPKNVRHDGRLLRNLSLLNLLLSLLLSMLNLRVHNLGQILLFNLGETSLSTHLLFWSILTHLSLI